MIVMTMVRIIEDDKYEVFWLRPYYFLYIGFPVKFPRKTPAMVIVEFAQEIGYKKLWLDYTSLVPTV